MRKEKKEVEIELTGVEVQAYGYNNKKYIYTIESYKHITKDNFKAFIDVDIPETFKEFKKQKGVTNKQILEFLNKNYK